MKHDFLMIAKDALPPHFLIVAQAKREIEYEKKTVSEVCDKYGVSRSTYYKYKDKVFEPRKSTAAKPYSVLKRRTSRACFPPF